MNCKIRQTLLEFKRLTAVGDSDTLANTVMVQIDLIFVSEIKTKGIRTRNARRHWNAYFVKMSVNNIHLSCCIKIIRIHEKKFFLVLS